MLLRTFSLGLLLLWAGVSAAETPAIRVTDDNGNSIELQQPAQNIISLAPHITELLYEAGAGEQVKGVVEYSDYPPEAKSKPLVGSYTNINIEKVISLQPDLILAYSSGNPPRQLDQLQALGIPVYFSDPKTIPDIINNIRQLGKITGHPDTANTRADQLQQRYDNLTETYANAEPVSIFVQIWHKPLMTVDNHHVIGQAISVCGGQNLFPELVSDFAQVSMESVIAKNPQSILLMATHGTGNVSEVLSPGWTAMQATQNSQLLSVDENLLYRASGRLLDGTEQLCKKLDGVRQYYASKKNASEQYLISSH